MLYENELGHLFSINRLGYLLLVSLGSNHLFPFYLARRVGISILCSAFAVNFIVIEKEEYTRRRMPLIAQEGDFTQILCIAWLSDFTSERQTSPWDF